VNGGAILGDIQDGAPFSDRRTEVAHLGRGHGSVVGTGATPYAQGAGKANQNPKAIKHGSDTTRNIGKRKGCRAGKGTQAAKTWHGRPAHVSRAGCPCHEMRFRDRYLVPLADRRKMRWISWTPAFAGGTGPEGSRKFVIPAKARIQLGAARTFFNGLLGMTRWRSGV
jgi:hypothetical protein